MSTVERRHDIDWLRTVAVWLLVPFHTACIYTGWPFLSSQERSFMTDFIVGFVNVWHMPLFFFLAGIGTYYALRKRDAKAFVEERFFRLFVPLVFGTFVVIPFQPYYQRLFDGSFHGNFLRFYPKFFEGIYPKGNFSYSNLWFLLYLFIFSLACLPLFTIVRRKHGDAIDARLIQLASRPGALLLLAIPFIVIEVTLRPIFPGLQTFFTDWANVLRYGLLYTFGFYYVAIPGLAGIICRERRIWLTVAASITLVLASLLLPKIIVPTLGYNPESLFFTGAGGFLMWAWLLTFLGYAHHYLNFDHAILRRFTPISLPFYIVHQSVLIAIGYYVLMAGFSLYPAFLTIVLLTFAASWLLADFGIRPWKITQFCFGMKGKLG